VEEILEMIDAHCHYPGEELEDYDVEREAEIHDNFKHALRRLDWWNEDQRQSQYMWRLLTNERRLGHYHCALRYFEGEYVIAYHRDEY
jgi:hypothetical protein